MTKSPIKKDLDLLLKFLYKSGGLLPDFCWECRRSDYDEETYYRCAWKLNRYGDKIWEQLSQETKDRWFYLINKPYKKALKEMEGVKWQK